LRVLAGTLAPARGGTQADVEPEAGGRYPTVHWLVLLSRETDLPGVNPMLGPLADNGDAGAAGGQRRGDDDPGTAPVQPAVKAGGVTGSSSCPATDQRGLSRPWGPACDIGAFELHYHR
jgi:hypothetical protein